MKVGIIGAGIGGLSLARCLQVMNCGVKSVKVLEKSKELKPALGGSFALNGGSVVLAKVGLGEELVKRRNPLLRISQKSNGKLLRTSDISSIINDPVYLHKGESVVGIYMRDETQRMLVDSLEPGTLSLGKKADKVVLEGNGSTVHFEDGTSEQFDLLIGADGIRSVVRKEFWGPFSPTFSGFGVLYAVSPSSASKREDPNLVLQEYRPGGICMTQTAGGPGQSFDICALVWRSPEPKDFDWINPCVKEDFVKELAKWKPYIKEDEEQYRIIENATRVFDWSIYFHPVLNKWSVEDKVVLLGDSCHATTPFVGQGANQAVLDAYSLADKMERWQSGEFTSLKSAIDEYERIRVPVTKKIVDMSGMMGAIETCSFPMSFLRDMLFRSPVVLKVFAKEMKPVY